MKARELLLLLGLTIAATGTASAAVHSVAYNKITAAAGTVVTLGGTDYTIMRIPFATFDQLRYSVFLPVATEGGTAFIQTTHTDAALATNKTIDGVPARVRVGDGRTYVVAGQPGVFSQFSVSSNASVTIDFKIGNTLVTIVLSIDTNETNANAGAAVDLRSKAEWADYQDLTAQIAVLNSLIDYIRIIAPAS
jgi:hypothetical protein